MELIIPRTFLRKYFEYLYYSILPEIYLWGKNGTIIVEPICTLKINKNKIQDWKLIDELLDSEFKISDIRNYIENGIDYSDMSEVEQALFPISNNIFELGDNPFLYPGERIGKLVNKILPSNPKIVEDIDGFCHFHPFDASFSEIDIQTFENLSGVLEKYGKERIVAVVIGGNDMPKYIEMSKNSELEFIEYMMDDLENIKFSVKIFNTKQNDEFIDISLT